MGAAVVGTHIHTYIIRESCVVAARYLCVCQKVVVKPWRRRRQRGVQLQERRTGKKENKSVFKERAERSDVEKKQQQKNKNRSSSGDRESALRRRHGVLSFDLFHFPPETPAVKPARGNFEERDSFTY